MDSNFNFILIQGLWWVFVILFLAMFVEANLTILAAAFLINQSALPPVMFLAVVLGAFAEQLALFWLGTKIKPAGFFARWADRLAHAYDAHLLQRTFRSLIVSKFVYGLHRAVLLRTGMLGLSLKKFLKASAPATAIWLLIVAGLGFAFGTSFNVVRRLLKYGELALLVLLAVFLMVQFLAAKYLKKEL